jgi:hypothetical protein
MVKVTSGRWMDDNPAAMRYTEARLRRIAEELLADIDKETVDFNSILMITLRSQPFCQAEFQTFW